MARETNGEDIRGAAVDIEMAAAATMNTVQENGKGGDGNASTCKKAKEREVEKENATSEEGNYIQKMTGSRKNYLGKDAAEAREAREKKKRQKEDGRQMKDEIETMTIAHRT